MSPHAMNTFVSDLVEMAKAVEELPQVKAELEAARHDLNTAADRIQQLELRIIDYKNKIDDQVALTRKVEADRDEAERLFLEETDRTSAFKSFVEGLFGTAGNLLRAQAPTAPVAVQAEEQVPAGGMSEQTVNVEAPPARHDMFPEPEYYAKPSDVSLTGDPSNIDSMAIGPGQSEPLPPSQCSDGSNNTATDKPYANKLYMLLPGGYIAREEWHWGGGTDATYDWREGNPMPAGFNYQP